MKQKSDNNSIPNMTHSFSIFIFDNNNSIGHALCKELIKNFKIVYVGKEEPLLKDNSGIAGQNFYYYKYRKRFPQIPKVSYSHFFIVYNGEKETAESFPSFIKAAEEVKAKCIFIIPKKYYQKFFIQKLLSEHSNLFIYVLGDLFSEEMVLKKVPAYFVQTPFIKLLEQVWKEEKIIVRGNGLECFYPMLLADAIAKLVSHAFGSENKSRVMFVFPQQGVTALSIARVIQKLYPMVTIDFDRETTIKEKSIETPGVGNYLFENDDSARGIKKTLDYLYKSANNNDYKKISPKTKNQFLWRKRIVGIVVFFLVIPYILFSLLAGIAFWQLHNAKESMGKGAFTASKDYLLSSRKFLEAAEYPYAIISFELSVLGMGEQTSVIKRYIVFGKDISLSAFYFNDAAESILRVIEKKSDSPEQDFSNGINSLKYAFLLFQKTRAEEKGSAKTIFSKLYTENFSSHIISMLGSDFIEILPEIIGMHGERTYAILFQNNMELRPGGGFIGSYALATFKKGSVTDFVIHDVYDADGQLKGHVEPPYPIRRYLPSEHWYLRDSNFNIDFAKNASQAAFFLENETGVLVDGVLGIDTSFVKELLKVSGSLNLPDYKETVTPDNLYFLIQSSAQENSFPGSSQKKDILRSLFSALHLAMEQKSEKNNLNYMQITKAIEEGISQKHILIAFSDPLEQRIISSLGMSSSLLDKREDKEDAVNDFIGINEANLGVNKANYFLKRKVEQAVIIDNNGGISSTLKISYKNLSTKTSWPGGDYKNYLRVILPKDVQITGISFDGKDQKIIPAIIDPAIYEKKDFTAPQELEVDIARESGKTLVGFLVVVPIDELKTITLSYTLNQKINTNSAFLYETILFKQPGVDEYPFSFSLVFPESLRVIDLSKELRGKNNMIYFSTEFKKDLKFKIHLSKNNE